jgi:hypothetical protein
LIGRFVEDVKEDYTIDYLQNAESEWALLKIKEVDCWFPTCREEAGDRNTELLTSFGTGIEDVKAMCEKQKPDVLVRFPFYRSVFSMS